MPDVVGGERRDMDCCCSSWRRAAKGNWPRITPFEAMLDHFYLPLHQPTHILLIPSLSFTPLLLTSRTRPRGGCIQDGLCFTY
ncbi:hypothetical protein LUU34_00597700 [Aix galericulata]|nr:hypothetical protein LUU34_00597700 [Aix galericulata]